MNLYARNAQPLLNTFERLLEILESHGKSTLCLATAILAALTTLVLWGVHFKHPLLPGSYGLRTFMGIITAAFAPPFLCALCIGFSLFAPEKGNRADSLLMSGSIEDPVDDRRRRIFLIAGVFGAANCLLMLATSKFTL